MMQAVVSRLFGSLVAVFGASIIAFLFLRVLPGNPARLVVGPLASEEALQAQMERMGLHLSLPDQYWRYITGFLQGDWGFSYGAGQPVLVQFANRLPASIELGFYAFLFAFLAAVVLGLAATYRRRPAVDAAVRALSVFGMGMPPFWLALILLVVFTKLSEFFPARVCSSAVPSNRLP
ncbi:MAG: ABC transporter permease [Albidovulum sp.]|nr:ABC transporter permease [Albidovulum sp.]